MTHRRWALDGPLVFEMTVPNNPVSVAALRHATSTAARACGDEAAEVVGLIITELVTNAIVHAELGPEDQIEVSLSITPEGIRGSVRDRGIGFEVHDAPEPREDGGFGLFIVQRMSRRWGVERDAGSTEVWFEL